MNKEKYFLKNEQHFFNEFKFKSGFIIKNAKVDYGIVGTPKYDDEGNIVNAVLFCHNFMGNYSTISDFGELVSEDKSFNNDDYFFISITSLGVPGSCSPSTSGLNQNFPSYGIEDLVNFQKQLLKEKFPNIKKLHGIVGYSFGGFIALGWSIFYPKDMDFVIHFNSSYKSQGNKYIFAKLANNIIERSEQYFSDIYNESISNVLILVSQLHYILSFSNDYVNCLSTEEINFSIENFADDILFLDVYDIKFCNEFILSFNLENLLDKIECKLLVIGVGNNNYYIPKYDSIPLYSFVEGSEYLFLDTESNPNELEYLYKIEKNIREFINSV